MQTSVYITTEFIGFHCWPDAPEMVSFLRNLHRHKFGVRVEVLVDHQDRAVEFIMLKNTVNQIISKEVMPELKKTKTLSCEMMAEIIAKKFSPKDLISVEVNEDGENGAIIRSHEPQKQWVIQEMRHGGLLNPVLMQ